MSGKNRITNKKNSKKVVPVNVIFKEADRCFDGFSSLRALFAVSVSLLLRQK